MTVHRYPFDPLGAVVRSGRPEHVSECVLCYVPTTRQRDEWYSMPAAPPFQACVMSADYAAALGVSVRQIYRWKRDGVPYWRCDELAVRVGWHVENIWPAWVDNNQKAA